jgi:hypothetical protein
MRQRKHALSGAVYDVLDDGNLTVTVRDGRVGVFTSDGRWVSGDVYHADPHLCGWLAGPQLPPRLAVLPRFRQTESAVDASTAGSSTPDRSTNQEAANS